MALIFTLFVLLGFIFMFIGTWPAGGPWMTRLAWGSWLVAVVIWALGRVG